ncbi:MAG: hypothetical protein IJ291_00385, partial [Lachnospiraceae bacterium]|nr:hypothetical protein [Lachnospiraceae bacterium]
MDNGKYVSDEIEVEVGTYTVEETLTTIEGYTVTTTYTVTTDGVEGADGNTTATGDIEVGDGESVVVAFVNTYTAEEKLGALKLTKAVAGALDRSELEGELQFKVENADGNTPAFDETYTLGEGEFTWNAVSGTYELLIEDLPVGNYKVTEIQGTTTPENMSCTVTYTVNAGATQTGTVTGAVEVTEDETSTVAYTNTYAILKGSIQVSKSFTEATGTLTWDEIKNNISFTIKDSTGAEIAGSPISGADLTLDNGKYVSDEIEVEVGTYTVEETLTTIEGYTVTTTYTVTTDGVEGADGNTTATGDIEVGDGESVVAAFVNTYTVEEKLGALKLTKAVAGALDRSELEGELQFKVENADGNTPTFDETYTLGEGEFTWNAVSGTYELLIEDLPVGNYKVTEIQGTTTPENMSCTVTYTVNAGATQTGTVTGAVEVT